MAIYHNSTKIISRSSGRSAVGASAYRSGEKIKNEYDGIQHDYSRKGGIVYSEVILPQQAKKEFKNRAILWNEVEKIEKSKNSQLAREVEVALPNELNREEQIKLIRSYVKDNFVKNGMCADLNIHDKGDGNPHAHIMLTMRPIEENGEWGAKSKKEYLLDKNGQKIKLKSGQYKSKKIETTNWNTKEFLESYREDWAKKINERLKEKRINQTVDHRSYKKQGIEKIPTIHEGYGARLRVKRGKESDRVDINKYIKSLNEKIREYKNDIYKLTSKALELNKQIDELKKVSREETRINHPSNLSNINKDNIQDMLKELKDKLSKGDKERFELDDTLNYIENKQIKTMDDIKEIRSQLSNIKEHQVNKINAINNYIESMNLIYNRLEKKIREVKGLENEVNELGIFKFKQKHDLKEKINNVKNEIDKLKESEFYQKDMKYSSKLGELTKVKDECIKVLKDCEREGNYLYNIEVLNKDKEKLINKPVRDKNINLNRNIKKHSNYLEI